MLLSLNLLKEYVKLPKSISPEKIGEALTMHTVEVEGIYKQADKYNNVVVGKILEVNSHPNADRLQLAKVDVGSEVLDIVCGAPNIEPGQLVPVALVGAILPSGLEIKKAEVRGEISNGMLCAEDELEMGDDHSGIMILEGGAKLGQNLADYLKFDDVVFEVDNKSLSNRPDLWGHIGIARELSAIFDAKFNALTHDKNVLEGESATELDIKVEDHDLCPRYMAIAMDNIKIEPSPKWLSEKLLAAGVRPINNIVDITNFVMIEVGQPMHAFDKNKVDKIIVRRAKEKEHITSLDNVERELSSEMLVIANSKDPIAIAGVMGGGNSEVDSDTTSIVLESANFDYNNIRKTSNKLSLRTDASMRYEKGLDPNLCEEGLLRAIGLIKDICKGAKVSSKLVDLKRFELATGPIEIDPLWLSNIIGDSFAREVEKKKNIVSDILEKLGFLVKKENEKLMVTIPTWRATRDVSAAEDIVEEVLRIYGFNNIEEVMPRIEMKAETQSKERDLIKKIKNILVGKPALTEVYNYSFVGEEQLKKLGIDYSSHIKIANPITKQQTMMRQNLAPNLIEAVKVNQSRYNEIKIFEIGNIFMDLDSELKKDSTGEENLPFGEKKLGILVAGNKEQEVWQKTKSIVSYLFSHFDIDVIFNGFEVKPGWMDGEVSAEILVNEKQVGIVGLLKNEAGKKIGLKKKITIAEIRIIDFLNAIKARGEVSYQPFEKFPPLVRDLAFVTNSQILYNDIRNEIINFNELIKEVDLFDVYLGEKLGKDKKSLAFHVIYQADKTLTSSEVDEIQKELVKKLEEKFEAQIRDF